MSVKGRIRERLDRVTAVGTFARLVLETVRTCLRYRVTGLASEAGFFMLLSMPPLVLGLFGGVGYVGRLLGPGTVRAVITSIRQVAASFLSEATVTDVIMPTITDVFNRGRFEFVSIGFVLSIWSGSRALNVFLDTISIMYGQGGSRGIVRARALSLSIYTGSLAFGAIVMPLFLVGPVFLERWLPAHLRVLSNLYWPVVVLCTIGAVTALYHLATPRRGPWRRDVPGAALTLVIWALASVFMRWTIENSVGGESIYGPLSAPIILLIWLYAVAIAVLIGAAFNAATRVIWPVQLHDGAGTRFTRWARSRRGGTGAALTPSAAGGASTAESTEEKALEQQYLDPDWDDESRS